MLKFMGEQEAENRKTLSVDSVPLDESGLRELLVCTDCLYGRCGGLMVNALDSGLSSLVSSSGQGHCVVFLGKTLYSHSASHHSGV